LTQIIRAVPPPTLSTAHLGFFCRAAAAAGCRCCFVVLARGFFLPARCLGFLAGGLPTPCKGARRISGLLRIAAADACPCTAAHLPRTSSGATVLVCLELLLINIRIAVQRIRVARFCLTATAIRALNCFGLSRCSSSACHLTVMRTGVGKMTTKHACNPCVVSYHSTGSSNGLVIRIL
jgi:hypothetical protein